MNIGARQYRQIVEAAFVGAGSTDAIVEPVESTDGEAYRTAGAVRREQSTPQQLSPGDAELVIAIAQLAIDADRVDDPEERTLFDALAGLVYAHANLETAVPTLAPIDDEDRRLDHLQSHAAQLRGKPAAGLAFALAYALVISDLQLAPEEGALLEALREALGLDEDRAGDLAAAVGAALTPEE